MGKPIKLLYSRKMKWGQMFSLSKNCFEEWSVKKNRM